MNVGGGERHNSACNNGYIFLELFIFTDFSENELGMKMTINTQTQSNHSLLKNKR